VEHVTAYEPEAALFAPQPRDGPRRFRMLSLLGAAGFVAYAAAVVGGAPRPLLSFVFTGVMILVPPAVWWGYVRSPARLRRPVLFLAIAATSWLVGSVVWEAFYVANGSTVPHPPGVWDAFFVGAQLLVITALVLAMRSLISFRLASLDAVIVTAAGIALAAPFVRHGLENGVDPASVFTLNRPILSIVILMLVASAALRSWEGVPLSMAMLALAEAALTVGNLIYALEAVQNRYVDERWATLAWCAGAIIALLGACTLILRIDRPVRLDTAARIPDHPAGSSRVLLVSLGGLLLSCGVSGYGLTIGSRGLAVAGLGSCVAIGVAMAFRATESIRTAETAYLRLDRALADTERAKDELARANVGIQAIQIAFADLLNLADERTQGRMRELIEDAGQELAELLEEELPKRRR
jgi:hypothetical protein